MARIYDWLNDQQRNTKIIGSRLNEEFDGLFTAIDAAGAAAADQTAMEAATAIDQMVTPGRQHFHPSSAKFWVKFDTSGTLQASYNVTSITDTGAGDWTVNIATDFSSADWCCLVSGGFSGETGQTPLVYGVVAQTAGTVRIFARNLSGTLTDPSIVASVFVAGFGDQ